METVSQALMESECLAMYARAGTFYRRLRAEQGVPDYGFEVLYGPPIVHTEALFIGYQPSFAGLSAARSRELGHESGWRTTCEYATQQWRLATTMQSMFGGPFLERSMGTNAIFIRAPSVDEYLKVFKAHHAEISDFCTQEIDALVTRVQPKRIVTIGLSALSLFGAPEIDVVSPKGRTLTKTGVIAGRPALGVLHLTGSRISAEDRFRIAERVMAFRS